MATETYKLPYYLVFLYDLMVIFWIFSWINLFHNLHQYINKCHLSFFGISATFCKRTAPRKWEGCYNFKYQKNFFSNKETCYPWYLTSSYISCSQIVAKILAKHKSLVFLKHWAPPELNPPTIFLESCPLIWFLP